MMPTHRRKIAAHRHRVTRIQRSVIGAAFKFNTTILDVVYKKLSVLNGKKAAGVGKITLKIGKLGQFRGVS